MNLEKIELEFTPQEMESFLKKEGYHVEDIPLQSAGYPDYKTRIAYLNAQELLDIKKELKEKEFISSHVLVRNRFKECLRKKLLSL